VIAVVIAVNIAGLARDELGLTQMQAAPIGIVSSLLLAFSVLAHELGHSAVSLIFGIPIRRITLFLLGGLAEIEREPDTAAREFLVALAGPLVSLLLATAAWGGAVFVEGRGVLGFMLQTFALTNTGLALFNLLPGLPLDGGRLVRAAVWHFSGDRVRATRYAVWGGQGIGLLLGAAGIATIATGDLGGLFFLVLASFIVISGRQGLRRTVLTSRVPSLDVRTLVRPCVQVAADLPLSEALRRAAEGGRRLLVVDSYGAPDAVISAAAVHSVAPARRPWVTVGAVARRLEPGLVLPVDLVGQAVVDALAATPASEYLVVGESGDVVGVLARRDVLRLLDGRALEAAA
jgi:Zn-dependent protease